MDICIVRTSVEELSNGRLEGCRDVQVRVHVGQRLENEPPVGKSGMRQRERRCVPYHVSHNEKIDVQYARRPAATLRFRRTAFGAF
jgi:hypothetical protein